MDQLNCFPHRSDRQDRDNEGIQPKRRPQARRVASTADDELKPQLKDVWGQFVVASGASHLSDADLKRTLMVDRPNLQRRLGSALGEGDFDALVFPTVAALAPLIDEQWSLTVAGEQVDHLFLAKNTIPASGAGLPGISIPLGRAQSGLPFGIELDGARGDDRRLLEVARLVERVLAASPT